MKPFGLTMRGLIRKEDEILLLKRHPKSNNGSCHWELPGGKVEKEEFFDDGLIREIKEETNLDASIDCFYEAVQQDFPKRSTVQVVMIVKCENYDVKISDEHVDYIWANLDEIKKLDITEGLKKVLEKKNWVI